MSLLQFIFSVICSIIQTKYVVIFCITSSIIRFSGIYKVMMGWWLLGAFRNKYKKSCFTFVAIQSNRPVKFSVLYYVYFKRLKRNVSHSQLKFTMGILMIYNNVLPNFGRTIIAACICRLL